MSRDVAPSAPAMEASPEVVPATTAGPEAGPSIGVHGLLALQRQAGNAAVARMLAGRRVIARWNMDNAPDPAAKELDKEVNSLPAGYEALPDAQKVAEIRTMLGRKSPSVILRAWGLMGDVLGTARAHPDVFTQSVKVEDDILDHDAFEPVKESFQRDVEAKALSYLEANRGFIRDEMKRTGVEAESTGTPADSDADFAVQDVQKAATQMADIKRAKSDLQKVKLGTEHISMGVMDDAGSFVDVQFSPSGPPSGLIKGAGCPSWEEVNRHWLLATAIEAALIKKHPSAAYFIGDPRGDPEGLGKADVKAARGQLATALTELTTKIENAVPLVGDDLTFVDFPPIHTRLFAGEGAASGINWSGPVDQAIAKEEVSDANLQHLLVTLGVGTVAAALFILAELASGGLATFLFAAGATTSVGQAVVSWDKALDLATAHAATVDPELELVAGEQVSDAMLGAVMDTVFAFVDVYSAAKGAVTALRGGAKLVAAGKAGLEGSARAVLKGLAHDAAPEAVTRAIQEVGPYEARALTGKSFEDLAKLVGEKTPMGEKLVALGGKGAAAGEAAVKDLIAQLPRLGELAAEEAQKVLQQSIDTLGYVGTLKHAGGWSKLMASGAGKTAAGEALEAWRKGLVKELQDYIAKESDAMAQAVRTGTPKAASDLDVQVVGGAAQELSQKAEAWLGGRLGTDGAAAKKLLDAEIMVDPTRSHMIDILREVPDEVRALISARSSAYEKQMIFGARLKEAEKSGQEAVERVLAEAREAGVEPFKGFVKLSAEEQARVGRQIDQWMVELKATTDPARRAELAEQIAKSQAMINASHGDTYVGGAVRVWVTGRDEDVGALAKTLGMTPEELKAINAGQRVVASLNEGKWMDAALKAIEAGGAPESMAKAIKNLGKHGSRAAEVLRVPGKTNVDALGRLADRLMEYKKLFESGQLVKDVAKADELARYREELAGLLGQLRGDTSVAIKALEAEAKAANLPASEMVKFQDWVRWQARMSELSERVSEMTVGYVRTLETAVQTAREASGDDGDEGAQTAPIGPPAPVAP